ncbi:hypothetical protein [Dyella telluris]|uniref:Uncharacterized protein n=1 Tax=Dyella telluris TaxID=2763498 RepID=A0A7G8Q4F5_9GAMM|nr:hypothetical protein [Dyella telluris]QNK01663.1 hypothetical protein H8F01_00335 [Dyella telluris]
MSTPIHAFWTCYRQMNRHKATERLSAFRLASMEHAEADTRREYVSELEDSIGVVVVEKPRFDSQGWNKLKGLAG